MDEGEGKEDKAEEKSEEKEEAKEFDDAFYEFRVALKEMERRLGA